MLCAQNIIDMTKVPLILYYYVHYLIYHYLPYDKQSTVIRVNNKAVLILHDSLVLFTFESIHLKNFKYLQYRQSLILSSQKICDHLFLDPNLDYTFNFFGYILGLYLFSSMSQFPTYFKDRKVLESTVSWLPIESNQPQKEYYYSPNIEPNSKYYLEKYFEHSME